VFSDFIAKLTGSPVATDRASEALQWRWAFEHPYLFTAIKVMTPYLDVVIVVAGVSLVRGLFSRKT
jgi:hypothetical protein